jgi:hypothetical protein
LRVFIHAVVQVMLSRGEKHTTNALQLSVFRESSSFGIGGDEVEDSPELFAKELGRLCAIHSPPARLCPNLLRSEWCGLYDQPHASIRLAQLREKLFPINKLAPICLSDRCEQLSLLLG